MSEDTQVNEVKSTTDEVEAKSSPKVYKLSEVEEHKERESCWMVIHEKVYDVTKFLDEVI